MKVLKHVTHHDGAHYGYRFECPGCKEPHVIPTKPSDYGWDFDGNEEAPTFSPSILVHERKRWSENGLVTLGRCHSFVRGGRIEFLSDCGHALAGQTVPLPEVDASK